MSNFAMNESTLPPTRTDAFAARLKKRYAAERRFKLAGLGAVLLSVLVLIFLLGNMTINGVGGFQRAELEVTVDLSSSGIAGDASTLSGPGGLQTLQAQGLPEVVAFAAQQSLGAEGATGLSNEAWRDVAADIMENPAILQGEHTFSLPATDDLASGLKGEGAEDMRLLANVLSDEGKLSSNFDPGFLSRADATSPQKVGIWGALKGSILTMIVTLLMAFPIGVLAALYLEEYAPKNRWTDIIEVSINNLAAVPSIIFGLLGLAVFLWIFPNFRSAPLIGGMTLALMTMPVIVISGRNAIKAVPPSIRDG
ncbi:MAG: DUF3333 domain-containing protein, partial [Sphingomonadales bacterium]